MNTLYTLCHSRDESFQSVTCTHGSVVIPLLLIATRLSYSVVCVIEIVITINQYLYSQQSAEKKEEEIHYNIKHQKQRMLKIQPYSIFY